MLGAIFSPVGLVIIGIIAAIAGAAYLIYKNWEPIKVSLLAFGILLKLPLMVVLQVSQL